MNISAQFVLVTIAVAVGLAFGHASGALAAGAKLCKANETPCSAAQDYGAGTELKLSLAPKTKLKKTNPLFNNECTSSTISGATVNTGGETTPVETSLSSLTFSCTCFITTLKAGRFIVENIPGTMNAKVRWTEFELKETCAGVSECTFGPEVSKGIFLRGGSEAVVKFEEAVIPRSSGPCENSKWTGTYSVTSPKPLYVSGFTSESLSGAAVLCKGKSNPCSNPFGIPPAYPTGTPVIAKLKAGVKSVLNAGFAVVECEESSLNGEVLDPGSSTGPVVGAWSSWSFGKCNCKVEVQKAGGFSVDWTSGNNGALVLSGFDIATNCGGKECDFGSSVAEGGAITGGNPAAITATNAPVPKKSGIAECSSTSEWSAEYEVTAPEGLYIAEG